MADAAPKSLRAFHPLRWDVPILTLAAMGALITGLVLPVMSIKKLIFWHDDYGIVDGVLALWSNKHYFLACVIFAFSLVFPNLKLATLECIWFIPMSHSARRKALHWLAVLGKWSMLDVFVVALTIVLSTTSAFGDISPRSGLYVFAGAVLASMLLTMEMGRLARQSDRAAESG